MEGLAVRQWVIPEAELSWTFGPTGGPGGQHANRSNTRAELHFDLGASQAFPADVRDRMASVLGNRMVAGVITVVADETRSQWRNRAAARRRLAHLLADASVPPKTRRPTRPTKASKTRRVDEKKRRSETKRMRRKPGAE